MPAKRVLASLSENCCAHWQVCYELAHGLSGRNPSVSPGVYLISRHLALSCNATYLRTMAKAVKSHIFTPIHDFLLSNHFWQGVLDGFASPNSLLRDRKVPALHTRGDSVYQAWVEVGALLTDSMAEYVHDEDADSPPEQAVRRTRRESRERAHAR